MPRTYRNSKAEIGSNNHRASGGLAPSLVTSPCMRIAEVKVTHSMYLRAYRETHKRYDLGFLIHNFRTSRSSPLTQIILASSYPTAMPNDFDVSQNRAQRFGDTPLSSRVLPSSFYEPFFSASSKRRIEDPSQRLILFLTFPSLIVPIPTKVRALLPLEDSRPGLISLLAGKPNADTFPITSLHLTLRDPISNEEVPVALTEAELVRSLQYSASKGIPELLDWLVGLQEYSHGRRRGEGWDLTFGTGSSDLIYKACSTPC